MRDELRVAYRPPRSTASIADGRGANGTALPNHASRRVYTFGSADRVKSTAEVAAPPKGMGTSGG